MVSAGVGPGIELISRAAMAEGPEDSTIGLPLPRAQEVAASSRWLVAMRWLAGGGVVVATWVVHRTLLPRFDPDLMYAVGVVILASNVVFWGWQGRLRRGGVGPVWGYRRLTHLQLGLDWAAMVVLIHLTGGVESPLVFLFVFHIVVASLVFERWIACAYTVSAVGLTAGLTLAETWGLVGHRHVIGFLPG